MEAHSMKQTISRWQMGGFLFTSVLPSLTHLELYSIEPPQLPELSIFDGCSEKLGVYVPTESVETYKGDAAWSTYANYILPLE